MYHILEEICHNYIAQAAFWGWFSAQAIKFLWQLIRYRTLRLLSILVKEIFLLF